MNKKDLSERDICTKFITPALIRAGWEQHQFREEVNITKGRVIVRGKLAYRLQNPEVKGGPKRADYILYGPANTPLTVIEAKRAITKMRKQQILHKLTELKPELQSRFGVKRLALFGSMARDEAGTDSDVDILISFDGPATSQRYFGTQFFLEDELGCSVDLVTEKALRSELCLYIEQEAVNV